MDKPKQVGTGWRGHREHWYRFVRYQVVDGYIRPVEGAKFISYEPWRLFSIERETKTRGTTAIDELLAIGSAWDSRLEGIPKSLSFSERLQAIEDIVDVLTPEVLSWCNRHGLLGLLLHRTQLLILPPRWELSRTGKTRAVQRVFRWTNGKFRSQRKSWPAFAPDSVVAGDLVTNAIVLSKKLTPGAWLNRALGSHTLDYDTIGDSWGKYFPDVQISEREAYLYPTAYETRNFWTKYSEKVSDFLDAALWLYSAATHLRSESIRRTRHDNKLPDILHSLSNSIDIRMYADVDGTLRESLRCRTLFGMVFFMAVEDYLSGRSYRRCKECGSPILNSNRETCGDSCLNRLHSRKSKRLQREVEKLWKLGLNRSEIFDQMNLDGPAIAVEQVKKWTSRRRKKSKTK